MTSEPQGARPPGTAAPAPFASNPEPEAPQPDATVNFPAQAAPSAFESEVDATVKVVPGSASRPAAAPTAAASPQSGFASSDEDFLTETQAPVSADFPSFAPAPVVAEAPSAAPAPAASPGAMPQATLPSPVAPPVQGYAMTPPPMGPPAGSPVGPPPGMPTGPIPLPPAPRKPRNKAAIAFAVIAIVLFIAAAAFGILYSEKANDFTEQAGQLESAEAERDELADAKAELENEIVALQLERDNLQADSEARQVCSDALEILIADEYPGTIDDLEDLASSEYLEWAQAHDELYREVERQCLA
ncbi:hypothetical protein O1R50_00105 [Glycomyces luteolus]|uniref:Uncharacterized protein n=1 Tax=Glycomyces luteolus TaxID=2670330 RepID=A0A9X3P712_9ACTN|nr:hypothetical protein [Glycomyces luteolus]MDA1358005.1 hypothetical protein [Glycomyces luteolus]